ncbi:UNVERIFIED_CONTAM: hypothetical protein GTU68_032177 [Idotea baltica]|nr:hypothetical protein [Idotea baltica]
MNSKRRTSVSTKSQTGTFANDGAKWDAVVERNRSADGQFVYAVRTTGVFCRPSCSSRNPNRKNVAFFCNNESARLAGYRACKRCQPEGDSVEQRNANLVAEACRSIESNVEMPVLKDLAAVAGLSQHYFHRIFRELTGVTTNAYAQANRKQKVQRQLRSSGSVTEAMLNSGYKSNGRFYSQSRRSLGMKPKAFKAGGMGETIQFALGECSLGSILVAATSVGICTISLGNSAEELLQEFQDQFCNAILVGADGDFEQYVATVVGFVESPAKSLSLPLDIRGTAFQVEVWKALQETQPGETLTYSELAERIGNPQATRAVASACGKNNLALAIPCHRVVRADSTPSGYRWGIDRKRALLNRETESCR